MLVSRAAASQFEQIFNGDLLVVTPSARLAVLQARPQARCWAALEEKLRVVRTLISKYCEQG